MKVSSNRTASRIAAERFPGPVRAVAIHPTRALLATGGDDYKIKVWGEREHIAAARSV